MTFDHSGVIFTQWDQANLDLIYIRFALIEKMFTLDIDLSFPPSCDHIQVAFDTDMNYSILSSASIS